MRKPPRNLMPLPVSRSNCTKAAHAQRTSDSSLHVRRFAIGRLLATKAKLNENQILLVAKTEGLKREA